MKSREDVIKGLECCIDYECNVCHYGDDGGAEDGCCSYELKKDAIALLKAQEPRVMMLEEVIEHYSLPPVFPDDLGMQENYYEDIQPLYFEFPHDNEDPWLVHWRGHSKVARYLNKRRHTYNQKWRCWTSRPDKATREATPWE